MSYDVAAVRAHFPALREGAAHFDGPGGSQVPTEVAQAVAATLTAAVANRGHVTVAERRAERAVVEARAAMADLLGAHPEGIVFGRSMTQLTYDFSRALAKDWRSGDNVVVTRLDHDANLRPWIQAAEARDVAAHIVDFDPDSGELAVDAVAAAIDERTRVVAVTGASNLIGTRPDVPAIAAAAHRAGALCYVDGVHLTPHAPVDVVRLGADAYVCSPYKFCGPHLGVLAAAPELLATIHPDKLLPATDEVPERFEFGTLPYELLAGVTAAVDFIAGLVPSDTGRRESVRTSMRAVEDYEAELLRKLEHGLAQIDGVRFHSRASHRTPTVLFTVDGIASSEVSQSLAEVGVNAPAGDFYAAECARVLGLADVGGVRAGIGLYTDASDVARLIEAVAAVPR
ncbi:MAG TPA: cysteine desulfurase-like protein [Micromonosporaceae bacterium]|nr:cysteine desulfurase-like protein [Micromonosporaceae bacterium]